MLINEESSPCSSTKLGCCKRITFLLRKREYASAEWTWAEKEMESLPRLGLETINIATFVEELIYY